MPYKIIDGVAYGSAQLEIPEVIEKLPEFFDGLAMIVTTMDSCKISGWHSDEYLMKEFGIVSRVIGEAFLIESSSVFAYLRANQICTGFSELYLVEASCDLEVFPCTDWFLPPIYFSEELPQKFVDIYRAIGAVGYLSDGIGLNYAGDPKFAEAFEAMPDLETYAQRVLPYKLDRSGPFDPQVIGPIDIRKRTISL